jgi:hypothetical protein
VEMKLVVGKKKKKRPCFFVDQGKDKRGPTVLLFLRTENADVMIL